MPPKNIVAQLREREGKGKTNIKSSLITPPSSPRVVPSTPPAAPRRPPAPPRRPMGEFKKGGVVKETGVYKVHKGEIVVPASRAKTITKMLKK